ncbi:hypothetical protein [Virgibacillus sp. SK37]|uniref:hypothetical protein n=1 Tax=Virgibacillus sp. SK37 TaxID=403957 RepID=UPI0004D0FA93|nr:hypothetical protein [Virgibacillus sp. SK37]AIF45640.1 hypothetical protein X953_18790 [Virgibacillus sp. SK37]
MIEVYIRGELVDIKAGSFNLQKNLNGFDTLTFTIMTFEDNRWFQEGEEVKAFYKGKKIFGGFIHKPKESNALYNYMLHNIQVKGYEYLLDKITVGRAYQNKYSKEVLEALYNEYFKLEGIRNVLADKGAYLTDVKFGYISGLKAVERLAEKSNYILRITPDKDIIFKDKDNFPAPFNLNWENTLRGTVRVSKGNPKYRNQQHIVGGHALTNGLVEEFKGDGSNKNFTLAYPVGSQAQVYISRNGAPFESVIMGLKKLGTDKEGMEFFFEIGDNVVTQNSNSEALTEADIIQVRYYGMYPVVLVNKSRSEIRRRKELDKGTGIVGAVVETNLRGLDRIEEENARILNHYATQNSFEVEYETDIDGLEPGMLQQVNLPEHDLVNTEGLITSVRARDKDNRIVYSVKVINGPAHEDWVSFFGKSENKDRELIEGLELIQPVHEFDKWWKETEFPNLFNTYIYPSRNTFPSSSLYPVLLGASSLKYIAYYINGNEAGRVPILTSDQDRDTLAIYSRAIMGSDIDGKITHLAWIGGSLATSEVGTGIYLDIQEFNFEKSKLETLQIEKTDWRWL